MKNKYYKWLENPPQLINTLSFNEGHMDKEKALEILNEEKDYEDELVAKLNEMILEKLETTPDLEDEEIEMIRKDIKTIIDDSKIHSKTFHNMIQMVQKDGKTGEY